MSLTFPNIDPVALSIGPIDIRWYALAYLVGILLGWRNGLYLTRLNHPHRPTRVDIDDFLFWGVLGIIAGGRIGYVLFYQPGMIWHDPLSLFKVWQGGMSFHGGAAGVMIAMILYARHHAFSLLRLSDIFAVSCTIGLGLGRAANFINGELFGRVTDAPVGMIFPLGGPEPRHPSQLYEAALEGLMIYVVLMWMFHRERIRNCPGIITGTFLILYAASRIFVEFFREPDFHLGLFFGGVSMGQILCVPMILLGIGVIWVARRRGHDVTG